MDGAIIKVKKNGPYVVSGVFTVVDSFDREVVIQADKVALCRCGHSSEKPFCDGTHRAVEFSSVIGPEDE